MEVVDSTQQVESTGRRPRFHFIEGACPICDSERCSPLGLRGGEAHRNGLGEKVMVVRCSSCTHIYPTPMPQMVDTNEGYRDPNEYFRYHDATADIQKSLKVLKRLPRFGAGSRLLDVGSGRGELVHAAATLGFSAMGVETSTEFAEAARQGYGITVLNKSLHEAALSNHSFDVVTLGAVLEHVYRPIELLNEIERILAPNGILWLEVPNDESLYCWFAERYLKLQHKEWSAHLSPTFEPYHVQGFTIRSVSWGLRRVGLVPVDVRTVLAAPPPRRPESLRERVELCAEGVIHRIARLFPHGDLNLEVIAKKNEVADGTIRSSRN